MSTHRELLDVSLYLFLVYFISLPFNKVFTGGRINKNKISQKIPEKMQCLRWSLSCTEHLGLLLFERLRQRLRPSTPLRLNSAQVARWSRSRTSDVVPLRGSCLLRAASRRKVRATYANALIYKAFCLDAIQSDLTSIPLF